MRNSIAAKSETIWALERALQVIETLRGTSTASLQELYLATGIPKPSLLRIIATLSRAGWVSRRLADGRYRMSAFSSPERKHSHNDLVAEAAAPVLDRLCQKVLWPSDLLVPAGDHMDRRETSQASSPFFPNRSDRNQLGHRVAWLLSGVGRAYLAFCPPKERERILQKLRRSNLPDDRLAGEPRKLERILAETRERGYGTRDPIFLGGRYGEPPLDDHLAAIAVPLRDRTRVHGSINILWIRGAFTTEEFASRHLADLQTAAAEIVSSIRRSSPPARRT